MKNNMTVMKLFTVMVVLVCMVVATTALDAIDISTERTGVDANALTLNDTHLISISKNDNVLNQWELMVERKKTCSPSISCRLAGGHCVKARKDCDGTIDPTGCRGHRKCSCCIPEKTTPAPPTCPTVTSTPCPTEGDCGKKDEGMCRPNGCKIWEVECTTRTCKGFNCHCSKPKVITNCGVVFGGYGNLTTEEVDMITRRHTHGLHLDCKGEKDSSKSSFHPTPKDIEFRLYTSKYQNSYTRLIAENKTSVDVSSLNAAQPMVVVAHGWLEHANTVIWMTQIKDGFMKKKPRNIIIVQWAILADVGYDQAVRNCRYVGRELANLLNFLQSYTGLPPSNMHIIGFSLGGQLAGVAGHYIGNLARITGLDPAGPQFYDVGPEDRLDSSDADFVDVIHTNAGIAGYMYACGHVDFFMHGGTLQKGCTLNNPISSIICDHLRAHDYYIESLNAYEPSFGFLCEDYESFKTGLCLQNQHNSVGYDVLPVVNESLYMNTQSTPIYLARSISIGLALDDDDEAYHCEVYVGIHAERVEMNSVSNGIYHDSSFSTLVTIPTGTTLTSITVSFEYEDGPIVSWCPNKLDVKYIEAYDAFANNRYCVNGPIVLKKDVEQPVTFKLGSCI